MFFQDFSQQKFHEVMKNHPKNKISAASWNSSVYYFFVRIFAAWKQPKKPSATNFKGVLPKTNAANSPDFEAKKIWNCHI